MKKELNEELNKELNSEINDKLSSAPGTSDAAEDLDMAEEYEPEEAEEDYPEEESEKTEEDYAEEDPEEAEEYYPKEDPVDREKRKDEPQAARYRDPELDRAYREGYADGVHAERKNTQKVSRRLKVKVNQMRLLAAVLGILAVCFATIFLWEKLSDKSYGRPVEAAAILDDTMKLSGPEGMKELFKQTYVKYLKKAYVLFGTYPDCSYYKVVPGIERDDYDFENDFYTAEGERYKHYYKNGVKKSRVAVDVSTYQTDVDWEAVKASGVDVAIVRSGFRGYTEGALMEDSQFKNHMEGALAAGLECGVYFFTEAINYEEGVQEAKFVLEQIKPYQITQPIVIDTEKINADDVRANNISNEARTDALVGFCETIAEAGYTPMIYASTAWFCQAMDLSRLGKYEWWLAAYGTPQFPYHVEAWQYDPEGSVPGINGNADLNVWLR